MGAVIGLEKQAGIEDRKLHVAVAHWLTGTKCTEKMVPDLVPNVAAACFAA